MATEDKAASPPVLFSLQVDVENVALVAGLHHLMTGPPSVGFQLLQYELILLKQLGKPSSSCCVFEADPAQLKTDLETETTPLTFMILDLLSQERARLVAFAAVVLDEDSVAISSRLDRVCEWVRKRGCWSFRNHESKEVGTLSAIVTLSCLGRVPLPKFQVTPTVSEVHYNTVELSSDHQAIKTPVDDNQSAPPRALLSNTGCGSIEENIDQRESQLDLPIYKISETVAVRETVDSGVQCEDIAEDGELGIIPSVWAANNPQQLIRIKRSAKLTSSVQEDCSMKKQQAPARSLHTARTITQRLGSPRNAHQNSSVYAAKSVKFERQSPPPLFFRKTKQGGR